MRQEKSKSVNLVTFTDGQLTEVLPLTVPVTQPLAVLKGDFSSISEQLTQWRDAPQEPVVWLDIEITSDEYLHDIQRKNSGLRPKICRWKCCWFAAAAPNVNASRRASGGRR